MRSHWIVVAAMFVSGATACGGADRVDAPRFYDGDVSVQMRYHGWWTSDQRAEIEGVINGLNASGYLDPLHTYGFHSCVHVGGVGRSMLINLYTPDELDAAAWHTWNDVEGEVVIVVAGKITKQAPEWLPYFVTHEMVEALYNPAAMDPALEIADPCENVAQIKRVFVAGSVRNLSAYLDANGNCAPLSDGVRRDGRLESRSCGAARADGGADRSEAPPLAAAMPIRPP